MRPAKRITVVAACIAAGAVVTVAVAWGCWFNAMSAGSRPLTAPPGGALAGSSPLVPDRYIALGVDIRWASTYPPDGLPPIDHLADAEWTDVGIPARALTKMTMGPVVYSGSVSAGTISFVLPARDAALPAAPLWPGFAIDTAFYGSLVFLAWKGPGHIRRRSRRRRGLCVRCGYSRAGLASDAACPECGAV